jgi:hypothetical protein
VEVCKSRGLSAIHLDDEGDTLSTLPWGWDAVVCTEVLEHVDDDVGLLQGLFRLSDTVIYAVPYDCMPPGLEPEHRRVYIDSDMRRITPHLERIIYDFEPYAVVVARRKEEDGTSKLELASTAES